MTLVLDASMALAWIFERAEAGSRDCADRVLQSLTSVAAFVPPLWHVEVANALLVGEWRKVIIPAQSQQFLLRAGGSVPAFGHEHNLSCSSARVRLPELTPRASIRIQARDIKRAIALAARVSVRAPKRLRRLSTAECRVDDDGCKRLISSLSNGYQSYAYYPIRQGSATACL